MLLEMRDNKFEERKRERERERERKKGRENERERATIVELYNALKQHFYCKRLSKLSINIQFNTLELTLTFLICNIRKTWNIRIKCY